MRLSELLNSIKKIKINEDRVKEIEKIYSCKLTDFLKKYISFLNDSIELKEDIRTLTYYEIRHPNDISEDFLTNAYFPVFDCHDGTFACYSIQTNHWILYNIFDEIEFENKQNLIDLWND